jgi:hypothetical protein
VISQRDQGNIKESQSQGSQSSMGMELCNLFPSLKGKGPKRKPQSSACSTPFKRAKQPTTAKQQRDKPPVFKDLVLIPNPNISTVPTHNTRIDFQRRGLVINEFAFQRKWDEKELKSNIEKQFPQLIWGQYEFLKVLLNILYET